MIQTSIPHAILRDVLSPIGVTAAEAMPPGFSGASVFRCKLASGDHFALKRWPDGTPRSRVDEVHEVIRRAKANGCLLVPTLYEIAGPHQIAGQHQTVFTCGESHWEMMTWMPGNPAPANVPLDEASLDMVRKGAAAIARFHASVRDLGVRCQPAPAIFSRLERLETLNSLFQNKSQWIDRPIVAPELDQAIREAVPVVKRKWDEVSCQIARSLSQYAERNVHTQYVLRDVHREHILFSKGQPAGLIDFDAVRVDTPSTDLARWVASFLGENMDNDRVWDAALAGFRGENTLKSRVETEIDPGMARDLLYASNWISLANWLVWILKEQRPFPPGSKAVARRIRRLTSAVLAT